YFAVFLLFAVAGTQPGRSVGNIIAPAAQLIRGEVGELHTAQVWADERFDTVAGIADCVGRTTIAFEEAQIIVGRVSNGVSAAPGRPWAPHRSLRLCNA